MSLAIFDASYYVSRGATAKAVLTSPSGFPTGGIYFSLNMMSSDLTKFNPEYACAVFDHGGGVTPERELIYAEYKAGRKSVTTEEKAASKIKYQQRAAVKNVLNMCGISAINCHAGWESDDTMASLAVKAADAGQRVLILTGDKDISQLVSSKIRVLDTKSDDKRVIKDYWQDAMTSALVEERYGVPPKLISQWLALCGDGVDGIPGVPGINKVLAAKLLQNYGSLKAVSQAFTAGDLELNAEKSRLLGQPKFLKRNLALTRLNLDLFAEFDLNTYRIDTKNSSAAEAAKYLQTEFGFKDLPPSLKKYVSGSSSVSTARRRATMFDCQ